jgi:hypothetical protein
MFAVSFVDLVYLVAIREQNEESIIKISTHAPSHCPYVINFLHSSFSGSTRLYLNAETLGICGIKTRVAFRGALQAQILARIDFTEFFG